MKKQNSQTIISLTNLREIQNIISPVPTKAEIRKSVLESHLLSATTQADLELALLDMLAKA